MSDSQLEHFSPSNYILECHSDAARWASVSYQSAADALFVTRARIAKMVEEEKLEAVIVGKTPRVLIRSVAPKIEELQERDKKVLDYIVKAAKAKNPQPVFYADVMAEIGLNWQNPPHRRQIAIILDRLSQRSFRNPKKGFLISAFVHRNTPGKTGPGNGFFAMVQEVMGMTIHEHYRHTFVQQQMAQIVGYYNPSKVLGN